MSGVVKLFRLGSEQLRGSSGFAPARSPYYRDSGMQMELSSFF